MVARTVKVCISVAVLLLLLTAPPSSAANLSWNFENPPYAIGSIGGQDSWSISAGVGSVSAINPLAGNQSLVISGFGDMSHSTSTQTFIDGMKYQYMIRVSQTEGHGTLVGGPAGAMDNFFWVKSSPQENVHRVLYYGNYANLGPCAPNNTYQVTGVLDFTNHQCRVTVKNLTDTSKPDLDSGQLAMNPTVTTANAGYSANFLAFDGETRFDNVSFSTTGTMSGQIELANYTADLALAPVRIDLRQNGSTVRTETVMLAANPGQYSLSGVSAGQYDVVFSACKWLRKVVSVNVPETGVASVDVVLVNGDADGDNEVTTTDLSTVLSHID
ncbi:MAG: hypothetical protein ACYC64_10025 [Armatimonadota bacterium]